VSIRHFARVSKLNQADTALGPKHILFSLSDVPCPPLDVSTFRFCVRAKLDRISLDRLAWYRWSVLAALQQSGDKRTSNALGTVGPFLVGFENGLLIWIRRLIRRRITIKSKYESIVFVKFLWFQKYVKMHSESSSVRTFSVCVHITSPILPFYYRCVTQANPVVINLLNNLFLLSIVTWK